MKSRDTKDFCLINTVTFPFSSFFKKISRVYNLERFSEGGRIPDYREKMPFIATVMGQ